jgi:hypothetical protein
MAREIKYWLVRKFYCGRNPRETYYYLAPNRKPSVTFNPKLAMRWLSREGAEQMAQSLGDWWVPVEVSFPGNELCAVPPARFAN